MPRFSSVVEFLRLVQATPRWDRTPAILDEDLEDLFHQLGEGFFTVTEDPFVSGACLKCVHHYIDNGVNICSGNHAEIPRRVCSTVPVCNIFCKDV